MDVIHEPGGSPAPWRASGAVEIRSSADGAPHLLASGHRVSRTLVLTAGHAVHREGTGNRHRVRFLDGGADAPHDAELLWHSAGGCPLHEGPCPDSDGAPTGGLDLALLRLPSEARASGTAVRWGRFVTNQRHPVTVTGAPGGRQRDGARGHHGLPATVGPTARPGDHRYALEPGGDLDDGPPYPGGEAWHGVSGAGVFCQGLLIGTVQRRGREDGTLHVLPAARLLQHRCLARLLAEDAGTAPIPEPVELLGWVTAPAPAPRTPAALLDPEAAVVPLVGDAPDALLTWCLTAHPEATRGLRPDVRVRLVTAPGGWGKTRTAVETVRRLARLGPGRQEGTGPEPMTWAGGFLSTEQAANPDWERLLHDLTRPVLLVADRAEFRTDQLVPLLTALAAYDGAIPVRLLLLARDSGSWLRRLPAPWDERLAAGARPGGPVPAAVAADDHYGAALTAFAPRLAALEDPAGVQGPTPEPADRAAAPGRRDAQDPLSIGDLQLAALAEALTAHGHHPGADPRQLLLEREHEHVLRAARARGLKVDRDLVTLLLTAPALSPAPDEATLTAEIQEAMAYRYRHISRRAQPLHDWTAVQLASDLAELLTELYPARDGGCRGTLPEAVAAAQIAYAERTVRGRGFPGQTAARMRALGRVAPGAVLAAARELYPDSTADLRPVITGGR